MYTNVEPIRKKQLPNRGEPWFCDTTKGTPHLEFYSGNMNTKATQQEIGNMVDATLRSRQLFRSIAGAHTTVEARERNRDAPKKLSRTTKHVPIYNTNNTQRILLIQSSPRSLQNYYPTATSRNHRKNWLSTDHTPQNGKRSIFAQKLKILLNQRSSFAHCSA